MICELCGQRPATVTIKEIRGGSIKELHLCRICAEKKGYLSSSSLFDSFFDEEEDFSPLEFLFPKVYQERVNILDHFSERAKKVVQGSIKYAKELKSKYVDTEHLLLGLTDEEIASTILKSLGIKPQDIKDYIKQNVIKGDKEVEEPELSPRAKKVLEMAFYEAKSLRHPYVGSEHILLALIKEGEGMAAQILSKYGIDYSRAQKEVVKVVGKGKLDHRKSTTPTLDRFSRDLCLLAREGKLDPVIGRVDEINRVIQVLSRRTKNNPVLIGEPGVGKTAIAEGLAQRIVNENVPETLKDKRVLALDLSGIVAGTQYRGQFEQRLKQIMKEINSQKRNIILFVDELHTLVGAGAAEGAIDASNMLKPALARGELQMIGATTLEEYRKYIERDAALERRLQPILINEPSPEIAIEILKGLRDKYEAHHKVKITNEAIRAAVDLSARYIQDRYLPDKAIDLVDEAAAKVRLLNISAPEKLKELKKDILHLKKEKAALDKVKNKRKLIETDKILKEKENQMKKLEEAWKKSKATSLPKVTAQDIEEIVSMWTGIPVTQLQEEESQKLIRLEKELHTRIVGQDEAVKAVSEAVRRGRAGLKDPNRPIASFIFLGPTGVGKTELAKALTSYLFGDEKALIRLDMSEYMERHTVSKLIGSPPGYVGYEEGGQLTEKVRQKPYSVILLDEIEKAHPDVFNILLQILEDGRLTDAKGRTVDFKNTVIIGTSNLGSNIIFDRQQKGVGFSPAGPTGKSKIKQEVQENYEEIKKELMNELKKTFKPEFLNRIDEIIVFHSLTKDQIRQIVDLLIENVKLLLKGQGIRLELTQKARNQLAEEGYDPQLGARPLRRLIQKKIENPLSLGLLSGKFGKGDEIKVDVQKGKFTFIKIKNRNKIKKIKA